MCDGKRTTKSKKARQAVQENQIRIKDKFQRIRHELSTLTPHVSLVLNHTLASSYCDMAPRPKTRPPDRHSVHLVAHAVIRLDDFRQSPYPMRKNNPL